MHKLAVFQSDLDVGGIQKSIVNLLNNLDYKSYYVDLFLFKRGSLWEKKIPSDVNVHYINPLPVVCKFIPFEIVKRFFKIDFDGCENNHYDVAIDFNSYQVSCALAAIMIPAKKHVMWIHNNVEIKYNNEWKYRVLWNSFKGKFSYFDLFVPCSAALIEPFSRLSKVNGADFKVISNYIDTTEIKQLSDEKVSDVKVDDSFMNFVAVGRLCHQKGYDIMLDVFSKVIKARNDVRLYIIGGGPDFDSLVTQAGELKIRGNVFFLGNRDNPYKYMKLMDAFVSTSRYEGQPLNIMEAKAIGLPLYCSKNLEIYTDGLKGFDNLEETVIQAKKQPKHPDSLNDYNQNILKCIEELAE